MKKTLEQQIEDLRIKLDSLIKRCYEENVGQAGKRIRRCLINAKDEMGCAQIELRKTNETPKN